MPSPLSWSQCPPSPGPEWQTRWFGLRWPTPGRPSLNRCCRRQPARRPATPRPPPAPDLSCCATCACRHSYLFYLDLLLLGADDLLEFSRELCEGRADGLLSCKCLMDSTGNGKAELVVVDDRRARPGGEDGLLEDGQEREPPHQRRLGVQRAPDRRKGRAQQDLPFAALTGHELDEGECRQLVLGVSADGQVSAAECAHSRALHTRQRRDRKLASLFVTWRPGACLAVHVGPVAQEQQLAGFECPARGFFVPAQGSLRYPALTQATDHE